MREQLKQLKTEIPPLAAKVEAAWELYKRTNNSDDKQHYEDLKEEKKELLAARRALEAKLPGAGERSHATGLQHSVSA